MSEEIRWCPVDHLVEVCTRTIQSRLLLRPSEEFNDMFVGALGRAQSMYDMKIYVARVMGNHYHLLLGPETQEQLSGFLGHLNSKVAREVSKMHNWRDKVWSRPYTGIVLSREEEVLWQRLRYYLWHGVKEGLVEDPTQWPGIDGLEALRTGEPMFGTWINRTRAHRHGKGGASDLSEFFEGESVTLSRLPIFEGLSQAEVAEQIDGLLDDIREEAQEQRASGVLPKKPLGVKRILRQHPHRKPHRTERSPAPAFHTATKEAWWELWRGYHEFLAAYRLAAQALRKGDRNARFPEGCFPPPLPFVHPRTLSDPG